MTRRNPPGSGKADAAPASDSSFREAVGPVIPLKHSRRRTFPRAQMAPEQVRARREGAAGDAVARPMRNMLTFRDGPAAAPRGHAHSLQRFGVVEHGRPKAPDSIEQVGPEGVLSWMRDGVRRRDLQRLRKGGYKIAGRLDLHGRTAAQAQGDVLRFLAEAAAESRRCLLIVHGKSASSAAPARLKNCLNGWLREHPLVNAFHSANPKDGGAGALYVLIGKRRAKTADKV